MACRPWRRGAPEQQCSGSIIQLPLAAAAASVPPRAAEPITFNSTLDGGVNVTLPRGKATARFLKITSELHEIRVTLDVSGGRTGAGLSDPPP